MERKKFAYLTASLGIFFTLSAGCDRNSANVRDATPSNTPTPEATLMPTQEATGRNRLIKVNSWCKDGKPVVEVSVQVQKFKDPSQLNFLAIISGPTNSRVLNAIIADQPEVVNGEFVRQFEETYKPDGLYNTDTADFSVKEGELVEFGNYKGSMRVEKIESLRKKKIGDTQPETKRVPLFQGEIDTVKTRIISCSGTNPK